MKQVNVAILGQGRSGRDIHGAHILGDDRFRVVAVVDPIEKRRERARQEYGIDRVYARYEDLFGQEDIDLVINATPSQMHQPIAVDLMRHGLSVLQEKPIAPTVDKVDELLRVSEETGRMLAIFLQSRYAPQFIKVREVAESGVLGRLICVKITTSGYGRRWDWQTLQENVAGSLYNTGPHPVGQALEFLGDYAHMPEVFCYMDRVNTFGDAEDYVKLLLRAKDRPLIDVEISSCDAYVPYTFHIQGDRGTLIADKDGVRWKYFREGEAPAQHLIREPLEKPDGTPAYCGEALAWHEEAWDLGNVVDNVFADATRRLYDDVYACLTEGKPLPVTIAQVRQQIAVMQEAHRQNPMSHL